MYKTEKHQFIWINKLLLPNLEKKLNVVVINSEIRKKPSSLKLFYEFDIN